MSFLEIKGIEKRFGAVTALAGIDLDVERGTRLAIVGPSGSGKTTLLRIIAGFEAADAGQVMLDGEILTDARNAIPTHQRGIGIVTQDGSLFPHLTVGENIGFGLPRSFPDRDRHISATLAMVELDASMLARRPDQLSGGQQQRVALARAMATRPKLMLLDEPFSALDTGLRTGLRRAVSNLLQNAGITTILITHDQTEALSFADQVAVMRSGLLPQVGNPQSIYLHPRDRMIAEFMGDCIILAAEVRDGRAECALGSVEVERNTAAGVCQLMLRPEQIQLLPTKSAPDAKGVKGHLLKLEFGGRTSAVTLALPTTGGAQRTLYLVGIGSRGIDVGSEVVVRIDGYAWVLAPGS
ncbi:MAG TPA: ABC transporter ATP-binding protein [Devosiaceae bacterium]|jgi:iron(III) transport system ATP-binding protein